MSELVAVLGPHGTFTAQAAKTMYPQSEIEYCDTVGEVFEKALQEDCTGVVALENSLEGSVGDTINRLIEEDVKITGEYTMEVRFALVAGEGVGMNRIFEVLSHPHALGQCRGYLKKTLPEAVLIGVKSTADALTLVKGEKNKAALSLPETAGEYGLSVLQDGVQDSYSETRFISISREEAGGEKTSVILALKDKPGALYEILKAFNDSGINLTKIESRPARTQVGDYIFLIDFENQGKDVQQALDAVAPQTTMLKNLGSYSPLG